MDTDNSLSFLDHFSELSDPRIDRKKLYPLEEILLIVLCGSICGAQSWRDFVIFGEEKLDYFRGYLPFKNGIPCKNTFARVMTTLEPSCFKACFIKWVQSFQLCLKEVIAIDGKTLRKSFDKASEQSAIHMVSAFASSTKLVLAQEKVSERSNEITAIPKLLDLLSIAGNTVTIDAMGTQKKIAKKIREKQADYVLALKGNQSRLHDDVKCFLLSEIGKHKENKRNKIADYYEDNDKGHGRIETRRCYVSDQISWLEERSKWCDLKTILMIESQITKNNKTMIEQRCFISSLPANAEQLAEAVRSHWAIENSLHWVLDVTLGEDNSRVRKKNGAQNMAIIRHITLNLLQNAKKQFRKDMSIKGLQKKAGWGEATLDLILKQKF